MDALPADPDTPLPNDVAALQALVRELLGEVARPRAENAELKTKLDAATRHRFGRRSERKKPAPVSTDPKPAPRRAPAPTSCATRLARSSPHSSHPRTNVIESANDCQ